MRRALSQQRTLLIVDNLETVDDERVLTFIREVPEPTKVMVTTRHRLDVAYPVRLTGMEQADALILIGDEAKKKGVTLNDDESRRLYARTGGVPLAIVWSVAQMGFGYGIEAVLTRLGQPTSDIARFCFEGAVERLKGKPAYKLLLALSLFATDANREALGCVADLPELDRDEGLVELEKLSLVNKKGGRFELLPLTRLYSTHELEYIPQLAQPALERMLTYYKQLVAPPSETYIGIPYWDGLTNYTQAESLEKEWPNLAQVIRQTLNQGRHAVALQLFLPIVHFLHIWGLWDERLQLSREMCQAAHELGDSMEAWLWIDAIGYILRQRQQVSECVQALKTGRLLAHQFGLEEASILADVYEASLYAETDDTGLALKKIEKILEQVDLDSVLEQGTPIRRIVARRAVGLTGRLSGLQKDFTRQKKWYEYELDLRRLIKENESPTLSSLAYVSLKLNDVSSAENFLVQAQVTAGQKDMAWINYELAVIAEKKGDLQEAWRLCALALEQSIHLGLKGVAQECRDLLARLPNREINKNLILIVLTRNLSTIQRKCRYCWLESQLR